MILGEIFETTNTGEIEYVSIVRPQYGKPRILNSRQIQNKKIEDWVMGDDCIYVKNKDIKSLQDLTSNDVIFKVKNTCDSNSYYLIVDKFVEGTIEDILPNSISPRLVKIATYSLEPSDGLSYEAVKKVMTVLKMGRKFVLCWIRTIKSLQP